MIETSLKLAFSVSNLEKAWLWTRTSSNREYKQYFRHIYSAYAISLPDSILDLNKRLLDSTYRSSYATKLFFPKKSGILRPYSLLCVEDQIVYQALVNIIAERLDKRIRKRYLNSVFGNIYQGKNSDYFYMDWHKCYRAFSNAIRKTVDDGYKYTASFDLTACYDSIDHKVLTHFLKQLRFEIEFIDFLCTCLTHWTVTQQEQPIFIGHGLPQGPLPSGILSEVVLQHFDQDKRNSKVKYFRYVDDIRLFSVKEDILRKELVTLDMLSKRIGLFPQSSKIDIHFVNNIEKEIKSISHPPEYSIQSIDPDQNAINCRIKQLSPKFSVSDETRFKFVLGKAYPSADLGARLLVIVERNPHLYRSVFTCLSRSTHLSKSVSKKCIQLLREKDLYPVFSATLIRSIKDNLNSAYIVELCDYCNGRVFGKFYTRDPDLRSAAVSVLLKFSKLKWEDIKYNLMWKHSWWVRSDLIRHLNPKIIGIPSYEALINLLLLDKSADVALVAVDALLVNSCSIKSSVNTINVIAQNALRNAGIIKNVSQTSCIIKDTMKKVFKGQCEKIDWKAISVENYSELCRKVIRWNAYAQTDATAWINLTDTINDLLLDSLFKHDKSLGNRTIGNFGCGMQPTSKLGKKYPLLHSIVYKVHDLRCETDLSHALKKNTGKPTRYIRHKEINRLKPQLVKGYLELWSNWQVAQMTLDTASDN